MEYEDHDQDIDGVDGPFSWYNKVYFEKLMLDEEAMYWILNNIDIFVTQTLSAVPESVREVLLFPFESFDGYDDEVWDKFGQAIFFQL